MDKAPKDEGKCSGGCGGGGGGGNNSAVRAWPELMAALDFFCSLPVGLLLNVDEIKICGSEIQFGYYDPADMGL